MTDVTRHEIRGFERAEGLMALPARRRMEALLSAPDPEAAVAALSEEDFYLTVKEVGPDDALPLLSLARPGQVTYLFDIEWWERDRVLPARAAQWLERLGEADEERVRAWLMDADFDLLVSLFRKWIYVAMIPEGVDEMEARDTLPPHTIDDQYFWEPRYPDMETFLTRFIGFLFETHQGFYRELLDNVIWSVEGEAEEEAYRFHRGRLEDRGVPDLDDALEIYRVLSPEAVAGGKGAGGREPPAAPVPVFAVAALPPGELLAAALRGVADPGLAETLRFELAALANKVVVADRLPPDDPAALREAAEKVAATVNLGLDRLFRGDAGAARRGLGEVWLEHLFRVGWEEIAHLRERIRRTRDSGWMAKWPSGLGVLDGDWVERAELLLARTPKLQGAGGGAERLFRTRADIVAGNRLADVLEALGPLFTALAPDPDALRETLWDEARTGDVAEVTAGAVFFTAAANALLRETWEARPLSFRLWPEVAPKLAPALMEEALREYVAGKILEPETRDAAMEYVAPLFAAYAGEWAGGDPRLFSLLLIGKEEEGGGVV